MPELVPVIISLIIVEILLSLDNALVNAALVNQFPVHERKKLLRYGVILGIAFRALALILMAVIIKNVWLRFVCGLYLIGISIRHIGKPVDRTGHLIKQTDSIKVALFQIAIADRVFSINNIFAASSFATKFQIVIFAVVLGMISVAFAGPMFGKVLKRYKGMSHATFSIVGVIGLTMCLETLFGEYVSNLTKTLWIVGIILFTILYEHSKTVEKFFKPAFSFIQYVIAIPLDIVFLFMKKKDVAKK